MSVHFWREFTWKHLAEYPWCHLYCMSVSFWTEFNWQRTDSLPVITLVRSQLYSMTVYFWTEFIWHRQPNTPCAVSLLCLSISERNHLITGSLIPLKSPLCLPTSEQISLNREFTRLRRHLYRVQTRRVSQTIGFCYREIGGKLCTNWWKKVLVLPRFLCSGTLPVWFAKRNVFVLYRCLLCWWHH
jgi:hypothetical protein